MKTKAKKVIAAAIGSAGLLAASQADAATATFREGLDSYAGTEDTWFGGRNAGEQAGFPEGTFIRTATWATNFQQGLLKFNDVFDVNSGPVPLGATINSATLTLHVPTDIAYADGEPNEVFQMLVDWVETDGFLAAQWNDGEAGTDAAIQTDDAEAASTSADDNTEYAVSNVIPFDATMTMDVTSIVQNWSAGDGNFGFLFQSVLDANGIGLAGGGGLFMASSEYAGADGEVARPTLTIDYTAIPEPGSLMLLGLGCAVVCSLAGSRRQRRSRSP